MSIPSPTYFTDIPRRAYARALFALPHAWRVLAALAL
jgi:hypothetical protein